jgi:hypothetical protein
VLGFLEEASAMNRALVVLVVALGIGMVGCAADIEDPIPPVPGPQAPKERPQQKLSDPGVNVIDKEETVFPTLGSSSPTPAPFRVEPEQFPVPGR